MFPKLYTLVSFVIFLSAPRCQGQLPFSPITLSVSSREWSIPEDEELNTKIAQARATADSTRTNITFALESFGDDATGIIDYFYMEPHHGTVYLKKSFLGKNLTGKHYSLYVTASSTGPSPDTKIQILVQVLPRGNSKSKPHSIQPPWKIPPGRGHIINVTPPIIPTVGTVPKKILPAISSGVVSSTVPTISSVTSPKYDVVSSSTDPTNSVTSNSSSSPSSPDGLPDQKDHEDVTLKDKNDDKVTTKKQNDGATALVTILPIVLIVIPIVLATLYLLRRRKKAQKRLTKEMRKESAITTASSNGTKGGEGDSPSALSQWPGKRAQSNRYESWDIDPSPPQVLNRWEIPRHHLKIMEILGEGCFGQVWKCEAQNVDGKEGTSIVAVKTLKEGAGEREKSDLLSELQVMKMLDPHPNVVRLLGACTEKDPVFVVMEFVALGKLQSYLRKSRAYQYYGNLHKNSDSLSSKDLTAFAYQVSRGMEYLASKGIIHRDLAARNILIDKDRTCKVADFGFARDVVANHVYERKSDGRLPIRWMAPEALYDNIFTTKTDVWSFGILMWEIVTLGSTPYPGMAAGEVMRKVRDGSRLEKPEHCRRELYNIMFYCWAHNPDDRPTFSELVNFLRHLLFSETDYIELDRFPDHDYYNMSSLSGEKL